MVNYAPPCARISLSHWTGFGSHHYFGHGFAPQRVRGKGSVHIYNFSVLQWFYTGPPRLRLDDILPSRLRRDQSRKRPASREGRWPEVATSLPPQKWIVISPFSMGPPSFKFGVDLEYNFRWTIFPITKPLSQDKDGRNCDTDFSVVAVTQTFRESIRLRGKRGTLYL